MSFGCQAPPEPAKELKRSPDSLDVAERRRENTGRRKKGGRKTRKRTEGKLRTHEVFYEHLASRPFAHSAPNLRNELLRTHRALMSVPLLIDPTRPAGIFVPVATSTITIRPTR